MAVLRIGLKCSHTNVYAPLLRRTAPFEHLNFLRSRCEIPQIAGAMNPDPQF
jgi:hypothetical protein